MTNVPDDSSVVVSGLGMVASLGLDAVTNCAAARAGLSRATELNVVNFAGDEVWGNEPVVGHTAGPVAEGFVGLGKLHRLATPALDDLNMSAALEREQAAETGLYVSFSSRFFERYPVEDQEGLVSDAGLVEERAGRVGLVQRLAERNGFSEHYRAYDGGRTGTVQALHDATEAVRSGAVRRCVVGGVESYVEPRALHAAARHGVLKTAATPDGFMPGEAAAFVLLERARDAHARGTETVGLLSGIAVGKEAYDRLADEPPVGRGLADVVGAALAGGGRRGEEVGFVLGDLNGDSFRAKEWGYALVRLGGTKRLGALPLWIAALSFGETGAAAPIVAIGLGLRAFARGYAPADRALVWLVGDDGGRAAFCLSALAL